MKRATMLIAFALIAYGATGIYFVQPEEQALVRRCGRLLPLPRQPGAHMGLPWGWDRVDRIRPRQVKRVTVGPLNLGGELAGSSSSQFLTGDRNLINVRASVQYTVSRPADYVLRMENVDDLIANAAESVLAQLVAGQAVDTAMTLGKQELGMAAMESLQSLANRYQLGIAIRSVDIRSVEPPPEVAEAFAKVVSALREREQKIHQAHSYANRVQAEAQANAQRLRDSARSHFDKVVRQAEGEAARFTQLAAEYRKSPDLTARRLYLQEISAILPRLRSKLIIASEDNVDISIFDPRSQ